MASIISRTVVAAALSGLLLSGLPVAADDSQDASASVSLDSAKVETTEGPQGTQLYRPTHDRFNLHLGVGFVYGIGDDLSDNRYENMGVQGLVGFDVVLVEPLALSFQGGFNSLIAGDKSESITSAFVGAGLRLRFFASTKGALTEGGSAAGNLWLDAHFDYINHVYEDHGGYDIGLGYEFALFKNINMGPYVRFMHVAIGDGIKYMAISGGLAISIAGDTTPGDMDMDGVIDELDGCPQQPEDMDSFDDEDGCPEADNDDDGIDDADDKCPNEAGIKEKQGCPETDNDHDGIENQDDICADDPEDKDGFEDEDGCPDNDNDGDGIADMDDQCVGEAEDMDGYQDADGCPEADNDGDGIDDASDQCPNEAETKNGREDEDGCPDLVRVEGDQIKILQVIYFTFGKAAIMDKSFDLLNEVAAVVKAKPDIRVRVEGHTDDVGKDEKNLKLSQDRADSVKKYLVDAGVEESRLVAEGKGETTPIADNKTKEGQAANRRVEFHIVRPEAPAAEAPAAEAPAAEAPAAEAPAAEAPAATPAQ